MIMTYSLKDQGNLQLSDNFRVSEFACPDGADTVLIDTYLVESLQKIRDHFRKPVYIGSGYRTASYNLRIGGHFNSDHLRGRAADIDVGSPSDSEDARLIAMYIEATQYMNIGLYLYQDNRSWIHVGWPIKDNNFWFSGAPGKSVPVKTFIPTLRRQFIRYTNQYETAVVQTILKRAGFLSGAIDGKYGPQTEKAVLSFQKAQHLQRDGIVGPLTWGALFRVPVTN